MELLLYKTIGDIKEAKFLQLVMQAWNLPAEQWHDSSYVRCGWILVSTNNFNNCVLCLYPFWISSLCPAVNINTCISPESSLFQEAGNLESLGNKTMMEELYSHSVCLLPLSWLIWIWAFMRFRRGNRIKPLSFTTDWEKNTLCESNVRFFLSLLNILKSLAIILVGFIMCSHHCLDLCFRVLCSNFLCFVTVWLMCTHVIIILYFKRTELYISWQ